MEESLKTLLSVLGARFPGGSELPRSLCACWISPIPLIPQKSAPSTSSNSSSKRTERYFQKYLNNKNASGHEQSDKVYDGEDCSDCPLKEGCTKAKGNRQVQWNTVFEEMKAKQALECVEHTGIYARRKIEVESVFGHIKGNRSFHNFSLRGIDQVHTEFGIVALAFHLPKVAGIRELL